MNQLLPTATIRCAHCRNTHRTVLQVKLCSRHALQNHADSPQPHCPSCVEEDELHAEYAIQQRQARLEWADDEDIDVVEDRYETWLFGDSN
jgi:hypothetical protein